jgi:hypothetical protein
MDAFENAPPLVAGFVGFLLYVTMTLFARFTSNDVNDRMFVSFFNRGITVLFFGLVLSGVSSEGGNVLRALAFVIGVFPQAGMQAIANIAKVGVEKYTADASRGLQDIADIDVLKQSVLAELGITSVSDLARSDLKQLVALVGINPCVLLSAVDKALLLDAVNPPLAAKLDASYTLRSASRFVDYFTSNKAKNTALLGTVGAALQVDLTPVYDRLVADSNARFIIEKRRIYPDV